MYFYDCGKAKELSDSSIIVPQDSHYVPLTQQKYCCVPTCIQMVMLRHKLNLLPAEFIGYHLGLIVPAKAKKYFFNPRIGAKPAAGYGTQVGQKYNPNRFFSKFQIPLSMTWTLIDHFPTFNEFIEYLKKYNSAKRDVLICYDWPSLLSKENKKHWGHVCLLDKYIIDKKAVRFIDPSQTSPKWRVVQAKKLYESMKLHGKDNCAGFWELKYINR